MNNIRQYRQWRASRRAGVPMAGFEVDPRDLHPKLRDDQRAVVAWALKRGRAALFINTGGGKAFDLLEWNRQIARLTGKRCVLFAPLAVADQLVREGERWGIEIVYVRDQEQADATRCPVVVSNYELMDHFTPSAFVAVFDGRVEHHQTQRLADPKQGQSDVGQYAVSPVCDRDAGAQ